VEAQLPVAPQPWEAEVEPNAIAEVVAEEVAVADEAAPEEAATAIAELRVVDVAEVGERMRDLTIESPSVGVRNVRLILPANWDEQPDATWPVLYLLHGQDGDSTNWTVDTDIALRLAEELDLDVLMVMPDASGSYYSGWWNGGEGNSDNAWATFHIEELPQILESDWRASDRRAVAGLSMGGFGAMSYAARYPGFFRAAASYSGVLDPLGSDWYHDYAMWGDKDEQREIWEAHDPVTLAANLAGTPLFVSWGDGREEAGGPIVDGLEEWLAPHSETFVARLDELGIPVTVEMGPGTHTWETWNPAFESSLPMLLEALEE
jgi:diacylglycerol O-acyltransferase/trehalose O-mycolyltransferase